MQHEKALFILLSIFSRLSLYHLKNTKLEKFLRLCQLIWMNVFCLYSWEAGIPSMHQIIFFLCIGDSLEMSYCVFKDSIIFALWQTSEESSNHFFLLFSSVHFDFFVMDSQISSDHFLISQWGSILPNLTNQLLSV